MIFLFRYFIISILVSKLKELQYFDTSRMSVSKSAARSKILRDPI